MVDASAIRMPPGELRSTVAAMAVAQRAQEALRQAHPGTFAHVLPGGDDILVRRVRGKALLRRLGFRSFEADLIPLRTLVPETLDVAGDPQPLAELRVSTGREDPPPVVLLLRHDDDGVTCHVPLPLDQTVRVPAGAYAVDAENAVVRSLLPKPKFTLRAGHPTTLPLATGDWHVVNLQVKTAADEPVGPCAVEVLHDATRLHGFVARDSARIALVLPAGRIVIAVEASGFRAKRIALTVPDDTPADTVTMVIDYGE